MNVCIVGGGALGHVIAGWLANKGMDVTVLTRSPEKWSTNLTITTPDGIINSRLEKVTSDPKEVIPNTEVVLLTVPGYANKEELESIKRYLNSGTYVGGACYSSGFSLRRWIYCRRTLGYGDSNSFRLSREQPDMVPNLHYGIIVLNSISPLRETVEQERKLLANGVRRHSVARLG